MGESGECVCVLDKHRKTLRGLRECLCKLPASCESARVCVTVMCSPHSQNALAYVCVRQVIEIDVADGEGPRRQGALARVAEPPDCVGGSCGRVERMG